MPLLQSSRSPQMVPQVVEFRNRGQCEKRKTERAIGGLRMQRSFVGSKVAAIIEELVHHHDKALNPVLDCLGDKTKSHMVLSHCAQSYD